MITFYTKKSVIGLMWYEVCAYIDSHASELKDEEILLIYYDGICIYSRLGSEPITWEDVTDFFS